MSAWVAPPYLGSYSGDDHVECYRFPLTSCPGHLEILKRRSLSYRDLPLRIAEFGLVHRFELSGALHGLFRLRQRGLFLLTELLEPSGLRIG